MSQEHNNERGQMLLVVVLTMIVALTVGLSVVSRTITNLRISRQSDESQRAFQAAEAGVERALQENQSDSLIELDLSNNARYTTTTEALTGTQFLLNGGDKVDQAAGIDVWFSDYPNFANKLGSTTPVNVTISWGTQNQNCDEETGTDVVAALEVVMLTGNNPSSPTFSKYLYDPCGRIPNATGFTTPGVTTEDISFNYKATVSISNGLIAKVIPIFNSTKVGVSAATALPSQGSIIESKGESGDTVRRVRYFSSHPQVPLEIFPYSILSQ